MQTLSGNVSAGLFLHGTPGQVVCGELGRILRRSILMPSGNTNSAGEWRIWGTGPRVRGVDAMTVCVS